MTHRILEAALFLANRPLTREELSKILPGQNIDQLVNTLNQSLENSSLEVIYDGDSARLQVKQEFLPKIKDLSKGPELTRKGMKILALIASKKQLLQKDLKKYFRGTSYDYIHELVELGYLEKHKDGNSWLLKPTKKFEEQFQLVLKNASVPNTNLTQFSEKEETDSDE
ncbi:Segregation and condensation complex subunit ScpB [uncultured archaeon]|nr:Segregation and condensation complex subunit ScpB [uncultured archaeon]